MSACACRKTRASRCKCFARREEEKGLARPFRLFPEEARRGRYDSAARDGDLSRKFSKRVPMSTPSCIATRPCASPSAWRISRSIGTHAILAIQRRHADLSAADLYLGSGRRRGAGRTLGDANGMMIKGHGIVDGRRNHRRSLHQRALHGAHGENHGRSRGCTAIRGCRKNSSKL